MRAELAGKEHLQKPPERGEHLRIAVGGIERLHMAVDGHGCGTPVPATWLDPSPHPPRLGGTSDTSPE